jgi:tetratricopeptide (TPR) repeat protein
VFLKSALVVEMLCASPKATCNILRAGLLPILFLNLVSLIVPGRTIAQTPQSAVLDVEISGTVLRNSDQKPATQVVVKLFSRAAGIARSILTDLAGHFDVKGLPPSEYQVSLDEPGYEPAIADVQPGGGPSNLVLYMKPSNPTPKRQANYTISVRELKIPNKARDEFQKGLISLQKNDPAGSLPHFSKAVAISADYYEAIYHVGVAKLRLGKRDEAMEEFQRAVELSGGRYAKAEFAMGVLLCELGKPGEAESVIRRGLALDDNSAEGYVDLGFALEMLNRLPEAVKSAREALLRRPDFARAYLVLSDVSGRVGDYISQVQALDAYLNLEPNAPGVEGVRQARELALRMSTVSRNQQ